MRETLTFLAAAVLVVLALALAVPPFIDWTAYGAALGARVGQALDADVRLNGPLSIRLLPSPHFQTGALRVTRPGLEIEADGASLELSLPPLLRGALTIASARLDRPRIAIDTTTSGRMPELGDLGIDRLAARDASFILTTPAGSRRLDHVDVVASAESGIGPFKAQGFVRADSRLLPFRIATGAVHDGSLPIKIDIDPLAGLPKAEISGALKLGAQPRFEGTALLSGEIEGAAYSGAALPWRARFDGTATPQAMEAGKVEVRAGDSGQWIAAGTGRHDETGTSVSLTSERPDFDRLLATYAPARIAQALIAGAADRTFAVDWRADASVLGGEVVSDARVALSRRPGDAPSRTRLDTSLVVTRGGALSFNGDIEGLARAEGKITVRTEDAPAFARWLAALSPGLPITDVPVRRADIAGRIDIGGGRAALHDLRATLDRSVFTGSVDYAPATGRAAPKLTADLKADALDIDALPDLAGLGGHAGGVDLAVTLDARAIRVARVGRASVEAGRIALAAARTRDGFTLERLSIDNLGGATLRAHGAVTAKDAHFDATLNASQLGDLAALIRRVAPGAASDMLTARASLLAPATLDLAVEAKPTGEGVFAPVKLTAAGKLADTKLDASLTPRDGGRLDGGLILDAPEAAPLLRQLGVPVIPIRGQGGAKIEVKLSGQYDAPLALVASGRIAGTTAQFDGTTALDTGGFAATGGIRVSAGDLGPLLRIVAAPVDSFAGWPIDAAAQVELRGGRLAAHGIAGRIGGATVAGSLARAGSAPVTGSLHLDRLDLASLAAVLLGPPQPEKTDRPWSSLAFGPQPNDPPDATVDLSVDRLALGGGVAATKARAKLAIRAGVIEASDAHMELAGGTVAGSVMLRRQEKTASLRTALQAENVGLNLPWLSARLSGSVDVAGAGTSPATLVGSLGGKGMLRFADTQIARADPDAPVRVAKAVDAEEIALEPRAINAALARAFDAGPQRLSAFEQPITIAAGQGILAAPDLAVGAARIAMDARYDLAGDRVELRQTLLPKPPGDWIGPPPSVALSLAGPSAAPLRTIEANDLIATLASHGIAREEARIAAIEADQRERAYFNRRLKFDRALEAERKAEEARIDAARQEALKQEAARQEAIRKEAARQEALRQEAARREAQRARESEIPASTAPLDVRPPAATSRSGGVPSIIAPDPGTAGRY